MSDGRRRFWIKNPTLSILLVLIVVTFFIFSSPQVLAWGASLGNNSYAFSFLAGLLFASGLLAPFGAGLWSILTPTDILLAIVFGAVGGVIIDVLLLDAVKKVIAKNYKNVVQNEPRGKKVHALINFILKNSVGRVFVSGIVFELTGFIKAIPLPYGINSVLILSILKMEKWQMALMSFVIYLAVSTFFIYFKYALPIVLAFLGYN